MTNEELQSHMHSRPNLWGGLYPAPRVVCKNGFSLSVQASQYRYCSPRSDTGPYTHVEIGYPSFEEVGDFGVHLRLLLRVWVGDYRLSKLPGSRTRQ